MTDSTSQTGKERRIYWISSSTRTPHIVNCWAFHLLRKQKQWLLSNVVELFMMCTLWAYRSLSPPWSQWLWYFYFALDLISSSTQWQKKIGKILKFPFNLLLLRLRTFLMALFWVSERSEKSNSILRWDLMIEEKEIIAAWRIQSISTDRLLMPILLAFNAKRT